MRIVDEKPDTAQAACGRVAKLELAAQGIAFPAPASSPFVGAVLGERLHLVTLGEMAQGTQHLALDSRARLVSDVTKLPLGYCESMIVCGESLIVAGTDSSGEPIVASLDANGAVIWQCALPVTEPPMASPQAACVDGRVYVVWATGTERSTLWVAVVEGGAYGLPKSIAFDDPIYDLRVIAAGQGLTCACIHGDDLQLELLRIADGQITRRSLVADVTQPVSPDLAAIADHYLLLWITKPEHELRAQWFDSELRPLAPADRLAAATEYTQMHSAHLLKGAPGCLAVLYQTVASGHDLVAIPQSGAGRARREPRRTLQHFLAAYDWQARAAGGFEPAAAKWVSPRASGWIGRTLLLMPGDASGEIAIYKGLEH